MSRAFSKIWIIVILIILAAGGIFAWQYFGEPEEIINWKTYKNEDVGFETKYPSNLKEEWKFSEESFALHEPWGAQASKRLLLFSMVDSDKVYGFGFSVYSNPNNLNLREFSQKLMDWMKLGCQLKTTEDILFGGEQTSGVRFIFHNCNNTRTPDEIITQVLTKENNNIIEISGIGSLSDSKFTKRFNLILSTFKFIERETLKDETADWKTYRNEEYGYEIKYPQNWTYKEETPQPQNFGVRAEFQDTQGDFVFSISNPIPEIGFIGFEIIEKKQILVENSTRTLEKIVYYFPQRGNYLIFVQWNLIDDWRNSGRISFSYRDKSDKNLTVFDQMLSTFRFIEVDETADWQTYRNKDLGFEMKYPDNISFEIYDGGVTLSVRERECDFIPSHKCPVFMDIYKITRIPDNADVRLSSGYVAVSPADSLEKSLALYLSLPEFKEFISSEQHDIDLIQKVIFGENIQGYVIHSWLQSTGDCSYFGKQGGKLLRISRYSVGLPHEECDDDSLFNQMLSTFRFLE